MHENFLATSLELQWEELPVPERNGEVLGYIVQYQNLLTGVRVFQNTSNTSILLKDLKPYTTYRYTIAAYTSVGPGPFGSSHQEQTDEDGRF